MPTQVFSTTTSLDAIIPEMWVTESLGYLQANTVMASLCRRDYEDVVARQGDTVNLSKRSALTVQSKTANTQINIASPTQTNIAVVLSNHQYVAFGVEDIAEAQANQSVMAGYVEDGGAVLAEDVDAALLGLYADASNQTGAAGTAMGVSTVVTARKKLNDEKIPIRNRAFVIGSKADAELLQVEAFTSAERVADGGLALRDASLGRLYNFAFFMDQQVVSSGSSPTTYHNLSFHRDAMALVVRPLPQPPANMGVVSSIFVKDDMAMRFTAAWSQRDMATVVVLDFLYGVKTLRAEAMVDVLN